MVEQMIDGRPCDVIHIVFPHFVFRGVQKEKKRKKRRIKLDFSRSRAYDVGMAQVVVTVTAVKPYKCFRMHAQIIPNEI